MLKDRNKKGGRQGRREAVCENGNTEAAVWCGDWKVRGK